MEIKVADQIFSIQHIHDGAELFQIIAKEKPKFFTYDTETTGLHVKADKPFKGGICFKNQVYLFDTTYDILKWFPYWAEEAKWAIGHNMAFDVNMTANIIGEDFLKNRKIKYADTMNLVQLVVETQSERRGGIGLKLKQLAVKYIDPNANQWELALKKWKAEYKSTANKMLTAYVKGVVIPNQPIELGKNGKPKKPKTYTRKQFDELLANGDLTPDLQEIYDSWLEEYPEPTYEDIPPEILDPYLAVDVILTKLLADKTLPLIKERGQEKAFNIERKMIPIVVRMARVGMDVDYEYLEDSKARLEAEIKKAYDELWKITDAAIFERFTSGQHAVIKRYYAEEKGIQLESSDSDHLNQIGDRESQLIVKLRTLEKWLSTYIIKIQKDTAYDGRFYSLLNPYKAVSGRFSGDCQQFPKFPLKDDDGNELFYPRRAFMGEWVFADFSQQELRVATHYALQLGTEDMNLFRAYMPYKCRHWHDAIVFDKNKHDWNEKRPNGDSVWVDELGQPWTPTDLHSATAYQTIALLGLDITKENNPDEFKVWRNRAKTTNFGKLYGAMEGAIQAQLHIEWEIAKALSDGYYEAFPSLKTYAEKIDKAMRRKGYVENLYGRRYYMSNPSDFYRAGNLIIQGSCAYDVKAKMILIQDYLDDVGAQTKMVMTVHDEIIYTKVPGEEHIIRKCVEIMENSDNLLVPLVSEVETTDTYWSAKKAA